MNTLDPKKFGLTARTVLEQVDDKTIALVIQRKSRIIMADGKRIREKLRKIREQEPGAAFVLKTNAPVCSKTRLFLEQEGISITLYEPVTK